MSFCTRNDLPIKILNINNFGISKLETQINVLISPGEQSAAGHALTHYLAQTWSG